MELVGGKASKRGIMLQSEDVLVEVALQKSGMVKCTTKVLAKRKTNKIGEFINKIPIVRGLFFLLSILVKNPSILVFSVIFGIAYQQTPMADVVRTDTPSGIFVIYTIGGIITAIYFKFFSSIAKWHGAEHMIANAYWNGLDLINISELRKQSRASRYCGTTIVVNMIFFFFTFLFLGLKLLAFPLAFTLAYEVHKAKKIYWFFKPFFWLSEKVQIYLFTAEPTDEQLNIAILCLKNLTSANLKLDIEALLEEKMKERFGNGRDSENPV